MSTLTGSVMLYNASFEPMGRVSFQHAVRMLVREVAVVHEQLGEQMIGPYRWPTALRLVRYVATTTQLSRTVKSCPSTNM